MKRKWLFLCVAMAAAYATPLAAQEPPQDPDAELDPRTRDSLAAFPAVPPGNTITVLAGGTAETLAETGEAITIFTLEDMNEVQGADLTRLLERAPGVTLSRNGGSGGFTAVRVRGGEGEQLLVLINGVRMADVASPGGGFDFGNLLMGNLSHLELQRSSNSTIWGSQALGGVLVATTGHQQDVWASAEYGGDETLYATGGANLEAGLARLQLQGGRFDSEGFSSAAAGTEADGFRQSELSGRVALDFTGRLSAFVTGRYADGRLEIDGFPAPSFSLADTAEFQDTRQLSVAAGLGYADSALDLRATLSRADTERENFDPAFGTAPGFTTDGESERAELRGRWRFAEGLALDFGGEREWTRFSTKFDPERRTAIAGAYAQLDYDRGPLHLAAGLRRDEHRDFGGEWSLGADAAWELSEPWRLTASYGEGFKAPTLFQLHSDFGNTALSPERSRSYDAGAAFDFGPGEVRLTAFRRDTAELIGFVSCFGVATGICANRPFGTYDNIGRARAHGLEAEAGARIGDLSLAGVYTLLEAQDRTAGSATRGNDLARRPKHALTLSGDWSAAAGVRFGADLRVVSGSFDDAGNSVPLGGYEVLTLRGEWDAAKRVTLYGRVENVWDESYQTAAGYATPGRGGYIGARARF